MLKKSLFFIVVIGVLVSLSSISFVQAVDHPRILLGSNLLSRLRDKMRTNDASWVKLKTQCDGYLDDTVEYPDGNDYGGSNNIGEGYQGDGYMEPLLSLGVCFQTIKNNDAATAERYANKGIEILLKMSAPRGASHYQDPLRDDGYGIRNFGVGMALGYDWLSEKMSSSDKERVYTSLNNWIDQFEQKGFGYEHPQGNYFAGYFAAKALTALATEGENPRGGDMWNSWWQKYQDIVQPYYDRWMRGGGWPEGWNYGPLATKNMLWPMIAAKTAKNLDLVRDSARPFSFANDQALNLIHFSWPNHVTLDDRGKIYNGDNPTQVNISLLTFLSGVLENIGAYNAPVIHQFTREVRNSQGGASAWEDFVFWNTNASEQNYNNLPLSYVANGMNQVAVRSSWSTNASWASFVAGPYINYPGSGEQFFDQGSLAIVKGRTPFLVNATGALLRNRTMGVNDTDYENQIYQDNYGNKNRSLYNIFYAGKGQLAKSPDVSTASAPRTRLVNFEDRGGYTAFKGMYLEDMYPEATVNTWNREVVYVRPDIFVVADNTSLPAASYDQYQAFHLGYTPSEISTSQNDAHRYQVVQNGNYVGSATTLYPVGNRTNLVNVFGSSKVYRLEVRPATSDRNQKWLTVFDTAGSADSVISERLNINGDAMGTFVRTNRNTNAVVVFGGANANTISYSIPSTKTINVMNDLPVGSYTISVQQNGSQSTVTVSAGGSVRTSAAGRLYFSTENGQVIVDPASEFVSNSTSNTSFDTSGSSSGSSSSGSSTPPPPSGDLHSIDPVPDTIPLVRLLNKSTRSEYYTANTSEKDKLLKSKYLWDERGVIQRVLPLDTCTGEEMIKIHLFASRYGGRYIYTKNETEKNLLKNRQNSAAWIDRGDVFCAYKSRVEGSVPVYRFRNVKNSQYIYIMDGDSRASNALFKKEATAYYAMVP